MKVIFILVLVFTLTCAFNSNSRGKKLVSSAGIPSVTCVRQVSNLQTPEESHHYNLGVGINRLVIIACSIVS